MKSKISNVIEKIRGLNWKRFHLRASLFAAFVGAIICQIIALDLPDDFEILPIPILFYAWCIGAFFGLLYYWIFVGLVWLSIVVLKIIIWVIMGLKNE